MFRRIILTLALILIASSALAQSPVCGTTHLVTIEPDGSASRGTKDALLNAVSSGTPLRVGWSLDPNNDGIADLTHWTDAGFLTIFANEVFTQLADIQRQAPVRDDKRVRMPAGRQRWTGLLGTNGWLEGHFDDGSEPTATRVRSIWCIDPRVTGQR
jgi:hypothetical protein